MPPTAPAGAYTGLFWRYSRLRAIRRYFYLLTGCGGRLATIDNIVINDTGRFFFFFKLF